HRGALAENLPVSPPRLPSRPPAAQPPGPWYWTVAFTTPALTPAAMQSLERELLAVEHRWPGSRFLGWTASPRPPASMEGIGRESDRDARGARRRPSQRELVTASLLRCAPRERRGIVHGRGAPR